MMVISGMLRRASTSSIATFVLRMTAWRGTPIAILVVLGIATHLAWFNPAATLFHADWGLWPDATAKDLWKNWNAWDTYGGIGQPNIQIAFYMFKAVWSAAAYLGMSTTNGVQISLLIPIAILGFLAPYFLAKQLFGARLVAFVVAVLYGSTTYFLIRQTAHLPIAFIYALTPLLFHALNRALDMMRFGYWLRFVLLLFVASAYELRMTLIVIPLLAVYALLRNGRQMLRLAPVMIMAGVVFLLLSSYWILPTYLGGFSSQISTVANRGLFGNDLFGIDRALTLSESAWTGSIPNESFVPQPIPLYLWAIPGFICAVLVLFARKSRMRRHSHVLIAGLGMVLLGVLLTKQSGQPFATLYSWLYHTAPGFNLYREASKFYIVTAVGYMLCTGYCLFLLRSQQRFKLYYSAAVFLVAVGLANLAPLLRQEFGTMFVSRTPPSDYGAVRTLPLSSGERTLWLPNTVSWSEFSVSNPRLSAATAAQRAIGLQDEQPYNAIPYAKTIPSALLSSPGRELMDTMAVRYIAVPVRDTANENNTFTNYDEQRNYYVDRLQTNTSINLIDLPTNELRVFTNPSARPYFDTRPNVYTVAEPEQIASVQDVVPAKTLSFTTESTANTQNIVNVLSDTTAGELYANDGDLLVSRQRDFTISYTMNDGKITLYRRRLATQVHAGQVHIGDTSAQVADVRAMAGSKYYASNNPHDLAMRLGTTIEPRSLGPFSNQLSVYSVGDNQPLVADTFDKDLGSFAGSLQDCNAYDDAPLISAERGQDPKDTARGYVAVLTAQRHTACVGPKAIATGDAKSLYMSFDYKYEGTRQTAFQVSFDNGHVVYKDIFRPSGSWRTYETFVDVPEGATLFSVKVFGFPDDRGKQVGTTYVDNFTIAKASLEYRQDIKPELTTLSLTGGRYSISRPEQAAERPNLIPNPSFAHGLWAEKVGDCNDHDARPDIRMTLDSNGNNGPGALRLEAKRHIACTGPKDRIAVTEGESYLLQFDYRGSNADEAGYYIGFNDPEGTTISQRIPVADTAWHTFTRTINVPYGATTATLMVYSFPDETTGKNYVTTYDNFHLSHVPRTHDYLYLIQAANAGRSSPKRISHSIEGTVRRTVTISDARDSFFLSMAEGYHPGWVLRAVAPGATHASPTYSEPVGGHIQLNNWQNAWFIDIPKLCAQPSLCVANGDSTFTVQLVAEFTPQRYFNIGLVISGTTLAGCIGYLVYDYVIRHRRKTYHTSHAK